MQNQTLGLGPKKCGLSTFFLFSVSLEATHPRVNLDSENSPARFARRTTTLWTASPPRGTRSSTSSSPAASRSTETRAPDGCGALRLRRSEVPKESQGARRSRARSFFRGRNFLPQAATQAHSGQCPPCEVFCVRCHDICDEDIGSVCSFSQINWVYPPATDISICR